MTKFNYILRQIKKRKRKSIADYSTSGPSDSSKAPESSTYPEPFAPESSAPPEPLASESSTSPEHPEPFAPESSAPPEPLASESSTPPEHPEPFAPKSSAPPEPPDLLALATTCTKQVKKNQTEKNKKKKAKYKLKKKQQKISKKNNTNKIPRGKSFFLTTTRRWTWKTLKSSKFTLKQKRTLFKSHNISKIIERNNSTIYNLKSTLSDTSFKTNSGSITFSQQSSTQQTPTATLQEIEYLENENKKLKTSIFNIKTTEKSEYQRRIRQLRKITSNHGYNLRKRITNLTTSLNNFLLHLQLRINLWDQNTALILVHLNLLSRQSLLQQEKEKLSTTNKVHNFTSIKLPSELTELLNKGTNFIPTSDKINISAIKKTISSEVNSTLCQIITKGTRNYNTYRPHFKKKTNYRYQPYFKQKPIKLLQEQQSKPNFNLHIIDYVHNTTLYTKLYLQSHNLQMLTNPQHINITQTINTQIHNLSTRNDIILTKTDKNMGWALVPTSWFTKEYTRHFTDTTTYRRIDNFDLTTTITKSNKLLRKLQLRFNKLLSTPNDKHLLDTVTKKTNCNYPT